ncbi:MAG TPA: response regulator transcription factor [Terriglobales bacterium]|jgi:DNA-binding response OmpR family regulator|nr:response regulator transcription factor [Terriglobales bacterium]
MDTQTDITARLLVAEDEVPLANFLERGLISCKYSVKVVHDGADAFQTAGEVHYDLMLLDLNLPTLDGISILKQLRPSKPDLPILVLTGRSGIEDRVMALDAGADDCLPKPFSILELRARIRALLRRRNPRESRVMQIADLTMDRDRYWVERAGRKISLTVKEFSVFEYLMLNAGRPVTRPMIMENVWKMPHDPNSNLVDVYVKYVRDKIDTPGSVKLLKTVRGVGYVLSEN